MNTDSMRGAAAEDPAGPPALGTAWDPWDDGPRLRKKCWTARQLYYLTPQEMHLESRRTHIGALPPQFVEAGAPQWLAEVDELLAALDMEDAGTVDEAESVGRRGRAVRAAQISALLRATEASGDKLAARRERMRHQQMRRRERFRRDMRSLNVYNDVAQGTAMPAAHLAELQAAAVRAHARAHGCRSRSINGDLDDLDDLDLGLDDDGEDDSSGLHDSLSVASATTAATSLRSDNDLKHLPAQPQLQPQPQPQPQQPGSLASVPPQPASSRRAAAGTSVGADGGGGASVPPSTFDSQFAPPRVRWRERLGARKRVSAQKKVYQGRFLVQERKSRARAPTVNEPLAPLETTMSSRWRECAVLARRTADPRRPLVLYFYDCLDSHRLARKTKRRWNRSLRYKLTLSPQFQMSVYSPLDFTVALWRPRKFGIKHRLRQQRRQQRARRKNLRRYSKYLNNVYTDQAANSRAFGGRCARFMHWVTGGGGGSGSGGGSGLRRRQRRQRQKQQEGRHRRKGHSTSNWLGRMRGGKGPSSNYGNDYYDNDYYDDDDDDSGFGCYGESPERYGDSSKHTHILLVHSVRLPRIMDFAYLVANAIGATKKLAGTTSLAVEVPALDLTTQVRASPAHDDAALLYQSMGLPQTRELVPFRELLEPAVSVSPDLQKLMRQIHSVAHLANKRLLTAYADAAPRSNPAQPQQQRKVALAWVIAAKARGAASVPLWLPSFAAHTFPVVRLDWLLKNSARIVLVHPTPRCFEGDRVEPSPAEGFCANVLISSSHLHKWKLKAPASEFLVVEDHYLFHMPAADAQPSMLASAQSGTAKRIEPYALAKMPAQRAAAADDAKSIYSDYRSARSTFGEEPDSAASAADATTTTNSNSSSSSSSSRTEQSSLDEIDTIGWISRSTCLREVDFHDAIARNEFERRCSQLERARGLLNLLHVTDIECEGSALRISYAGDGRYMQIQFDDEETAVCWRDSLRSTAAFWQARHKAELICAATNVQDDWTITPLLQNRAVVFSGQLFIKHHLYTSFKPHLVVLTPHKLLVFRTRQHHAPAWDLAHKAPAVALHHKLYLAISLDDAYVYTGQAAAQGIAVHNDSFTDPANPGVRALPRTYEDGSISTETELDRCFVVRTPKITYTFLARSRLVRDRWSTAIRYTSSNQSSAVDPLESADFEYSWQTA